MSLCCIIEMFEIGRWKYLGQLRSTVVVFLNICWWLNDCVIMNKYLKVNLRSFSWCFRWVVSLSCWRITLSVRQSQLLVSCASGTGESRAELRWLALSNSLTLRRCRGCSGLPQGRSCAEAAPRPHSGLNSLQQETPVLAFPWERRAGEPPLPGPTGHVTEGNVHSLLLAGKAVGEGEEQGGGAEEGGKGRRCVQAQACDVLFPRKSLLSAR